MQFRNRIARASLALWLGSGSFCLGLLLVFSPVCMAQIADKKPEQEAANPVKEPAPEKPAEADEADSTPKTNTNEPAKEIQPADELAVNQAEVADRFKQLKRMMLHLSEFSAGSDPHRASVLKQAISESEQRELVIRFEAIVKLLEKQQFALAEKNQTELRAELEKLLQLLLKEDRANRVDAEKKRIEGLIKEVGRIIKDQRGVKARTEGGDDLERLRDAQNKIGEKSKNLAEQIAKDEAENKASSGETEAESGKPDEKSDSSPEGKEKPAGKQPKKQPDGEKKADEKTPPKGGEKGEPKQPMEGTPPEPEQSPDGPPKEGEPNKGEPRSGESPEGDSQPMPNKSQPMPNKSQPMPGQQQEGESGESPQPQQPPQESDNERVRKRIEAARERMEEAEKKLKEAQREGAAEEQQQALDELEQAKAELEKILRQLREEEVERVLVQLEDRFRRMLKQQIEIYEGTKRLENVPVADRGRDDEIEAGRLSRLELQIVTETDKALNLLRDEGSAVAFPEAVGQMRDDMEQIATRLSQLKTDKLTQGLEEDVISALEEMIEALKRAQKELEEKKNQGQSPSQMGEPGDQALVDALAELRMIRALQMRVNNRTKLYSGMITGEQADQPELLKALEDLAARQKRIQQVTRDLHLGKNQ